MGLRLFAGIRAQRSSRDQRRSELRLTSGPPLPANQEVALAELNRTLDRMLAAKERLDAKAAIVPAVIGTVAAIAVGHARADLGADPLPLFSLSFTVAAALLSLCFSIACLSASGHAIGAAPGDLIHQSDIEPLNFQQRVNIELAIATEEAGAVVESKGVRLNLALFSGALAALGLLLLALLGGLR